MLKLHPSAGYAIRIRAEIENVPGALGRLTSAIGRAGGNIEALDLVEHRRTTLVRELSVQCRDVEQGKEVVRHARRVHGVRIESVSDRTFDVHRGGKIEIACRSPVKTRDDLAMVYTPGVGRVSSAIASDPELVWELTIKRNSVAVLTDGSAVLGLGDLGPEAAIPVMEGKAMLFQGVSRNRCLSNLRARRERGAADHGGGRYRPRIRGYQPRGHRRTPVLRGRATTPPDP